MACKYCSGHIEHDDDGWIDEVGERVPLDGGLSCRDDSYLTVEFSHNGDHYTGTLWANIDVEWEERPITVQLGGEKVGEYHLPSEYSEFNGMWCVYINYCPFCGEKLSARLDGGAE